MGIGGAKARECVWTEQQCKGAYGSNNNDGARAATPPSLTSCLNAHPSLQQWTPRQCLEAHPQLGDEGRGSRGVVFGYRRYEGVDILGSTLPDQRFSESSAEDCAKACGGAPDCNAFVFRSDESEDNCILKHFRGGSDEPGSVLAGIGQNRSPLTAVLFMNDDSRSTYVKTP